MADWNGSFSTPLQAPGPVEPEPSPLDPGWARWLRDRVETPLDNDWLDPKPTLTGVALKTTEKKRERIVLEGDNPGDWYPDKKIEVGEGENYKDYTRYRRLYPSVTFKWVLRYRIECFATYDNGNAYVVNYWYFWQEIQGENWQTLKNFTATRWTESSRYIQLPDGREGREEELRPKNSWNNIKEPWTTDLDPPTDIPTPDVMPRRRRPRRVSMIDPFDERRENYAAIHNKRMVYRIDTEEIGEALFVTAEAFNKATNSTG